MGIALLLFFLPSISLALNYRCQNDQILVVQSFGNDTIRMHCQRLDLCGYQKLRCDYDEMQPQCGGQMNFVSQVNQASATSPVEHTCCNLFNPRAPHTVPTHTGNDCFIYELPDGSSVAKPKEETLDDQPLAVLKSAADIPEQIDGVSGYRLRLFLLKNKAPPTLLVKGIERRLEGYRVTICRPRCSSYDVPQEEKDEAGEWKAVSWSSWTSSSWSTWAKSVWGNMEERKRVRTEITSNERETAAARGDVNVNVNTSGNNNNEWSDKDSSGGFNRPTVAGEPNGSGNINITIHTKGDGSGKSGPSAEANAHVENHFHGGKGDGNGGGDDSDLLEENGRAKTRGDRNGAGPNGNAVSDPDGDDEGDLAKNNGKGKEKPPGGTGDEDDDSGAGDASPERSSGKNTKRTQESNGKKHGKGDEEDDGDDGSDKNEFNSGDESGQGNGSRNTKANKNIHGKNKKDGGKGGERGDGVHEIEDGSHGGDGDDGNSWTDEGDESGIDNDSGEEKGKHGKDGRNGKNGKDGKNKNGNVPAESHKREKNGHGTDGKQGGSDKKEKHGSGDLGSGKNIENGKEDPKQERPKEGGQSSDKKDGAKKNSGTGKGEEKPKKGEKSKGKNGEDGNSDRGKDRTTISSKEGNASDKIAESKENQENGGKSTDFAKNGKEGNANKSSNGNDGKRGDKDSGALENNGLIGKQPDSASGDGTDNKDDKTKPNLNAGKDEVSGGGKGKGADRQPKGGSDGKSDDGNSGENQTGKDGSDVNAISTAEAHPTSSTQISVTDGAKGIIDTDNGNNEIDQDVTKNSEGEDRRENGKNSTSGEGDDEKFVGTIGVNVAGDHPEDPGSHESSEEEEGKESTTTMKTKTKTKNSQTKGGSTATKAPKAHGSKNVKNDGYTSVDTRPMNPRKRTFAASPPSENDPPAMNAADSGSLMDAMKKMNCFAANSLVTTVTGYKRMDELQVGDYVLVPSSDNVLKYERVEMFYHREPSSRTQFVVIFSSSGKRMALTPMHLLPFGHCDEVEKLSKSAEGAAELLRGSRYAQSASVGDCVLTTNHNGELVADKIVKIGRQVSEGIYSPMTVEGALVVDGVLASCFSHMESHTVQKVVFDFLMYINDFFNMGYGRNEEHQSVPSFINYVHELSQYVLPFAK